MSLPPDLQALLGGAGGGPPPGAGAPPPDPAPGPGDPAGGPGGPDAGIDPTGHVTSPHSGDNADNLRNAIMFVQAYMEGETDDQDLKLASDILAKAQGLLASQQQLQDKATGAGPGARVVRKATAQSQYGG